MRRREFIALLGSAVVVWPLAARAQAMIPPTGMMDAQHPMPMNERYLKRFPATGASRRSHRIAGTRP